MRVLLSNLSSVQYPILNSFFTIGNLGFKHGTGIPIRIYSHLFVFIRNHIGVAFSFTFLNSTKNRLSYVQLTKHKNIMGC